MKIALIGFFCSEYHLALANSLSCTNNVNLFLTNQNLAIRFPTQQDLHNFLYQSQIIYPEVTLRLVDYPSGHYEKKIIMAYSLIKGLRASHIDVVHYQAGGDPWIPLILPFLRRYPIVTTIYDATPHSGENSIFGLLKYANQALIRWSDQIIVHGKEQADLLVNTFCAPTQKINVIPMGGFDMYSGPADLIYPDKRVVLFFGRLRAYKGVEILIRAASEVAACVPGVRFVIAGSGEYPAVIEAGNNRPDLFEVHNRFIPASEVPSFFRSASIVVQPYLDATQSAVVALAYQFGRPVVATRVGSIPEVVEEGKTGFLVEPGDEKALAEAIIRLLKNDSLREEMGKAAAMKVKQELSWENIACKTNAVYERARKVNQKIVKYES